MTLKGESQTKFLADSMLGKLAKWMRMAGVDVASRKEKRFSSFLRQGRETGRIILTKDTKFQKIYSPPPFYFVKEITVDRQFREIRSEFNIEAGENVLTRCLECNTILEGVEREKLHGLVPDYVYDNFLKFTQCPKCSKIFWEGTHMSNLRKRILNTPDEDK